MNKKYIFDDTALLCNAAADYITTLSKSTIAKKGKFCLALSGGNTPRKLYELLATAAYATALDWKNIFIFWSDERCVPFSDEQNNSHMAFTALLNHIPIPKENIFPVPVNFEPGEAAVTYQSTIQKIFADSFPVFDLILLGIGDNGHTASLFPFTSILKEKEQLVKEVFIKEINAFRISFTSKLINNASHVLFLVTGEGKAAIVQTIFSGIPEPEKYPVQLINPTKAPADWYFDRQAAAHLK